MSIFQVLFSFKGRINRKPYVIAFLALTFLSIVLGVIYSSYKMSLAFDERLFYPLALSILFLWPTLALAVKRLHDHNKSGWFYMIVFVPIVGSIWLLALTLFLKGTEGENRFGPDPLGLKSLDDSEDEAVPAEA